MGGLRQIGGTEEEERAWDQETFERVYRHLMYQGARSCVVTPRDVLIPAYYGRFGRRCAVGCLLSMQEYDASFETLRLEQVYGQCSSLHRMNLNLLYALRVCHDDLTPPRWKKRLATIAQDFGLSVPPSLEQMSLRDPSAGFTECDGKEV